jgi:hypothetical protein
MTQPASHTVPEPSYLTDEASLARFIESWRDATLPRTEWTHAAHVAVGASHIFELGAELALQAMRNGIRDFNVRSGGENTDTSGYHETLTWLWCAVIAAHLRETECGSALEAARSAVSQFGEDRALHKRYYSYDVVGNREARRTVVPPDLQPVG